MMNPARPRPQLPYGVNWESEQAQGLIGWWPLTPAFGIRAYDLVKKAMAPQGSTGLSVSDLVSNPTLGRMNAFSSNNKYYDIGTAYQVSLPITLTAWVILTSTAGRAFLGTAMSPANHAGALISAKRISGTSGGAEATYGANTSATSSGRRSKEGATNLATNTLYFLSASIRGATDMSVYVNGVDDGGSYSGSGGAMVNTGNGWIGHAGSAASVGAAQLGDCRIYSGNKTAAQHFRMYDPKTRWDLYWQPGRRLISLPGSSTAGARIWQLASLGSNPTAGGAIWELATI